jgi:hypothetical protein
MVIQIKDQLENIAADPHFVSCSYALTDEWTAQDVGVEAVEPVLRFMEEHPLIDYGARGPLTHFVERFYKKGYEEKLVVSINRKPTVHTVSMLNALINGTSEPAMRHHFIAVMQNVRQNPLADENTLQQVEYLLQRLSK